MKQLIYRQSRSQAFGVSLEQGLEFNFLESPFNAIPRLRMFLRDLGIGATLKMILKLTGIRRRYFYFILADGRIVHEGWVSVSFCRYYPVEAGDAVIGPVATRPRFMGKGLASAGTRRVLDRLVVAGYRTFWIDTAEDNHAMQRVIEKCGFGAAVSSYERRQ